MSYQVVAPLVLARDKEGKTHHVYQGGVIDWLSDDQAEHFIGTGLVVELDAPDAVDEDEGDGKPPANATNADLVEWIVANVVKDDGSDYTAEELQGVKKADLRAIVDSVE